MSVIKSPEFKQVLTLNGQDVAGLFLEVLELGGKTGYMKYRTVPVYPQVGDKINKAIERIATKQQAAPEAMKQAQAEAIQDLQKAGSRLILERRLRRLRSVAPPPAGERSCRQDSSTASLPGAWRRRWRCWRSSRCCRRCICWPPASRRST